MLFLLSSRSRIDKQTLIADVAGQQETVVRYDIMGMYDQIKCEVEETREHWGLEFQTKDLENLLIDYEITKDGLFQLTDMEEGWTKVDVDRKKIEYTGRICFYTHDKNDNWIVYWALLDFGKVLWIKRME